MSITKIPFDDGVAPRSQATDLINFFNQYKSGFFDSVTYDSENYKLDLYMGEESIIQMQLYSGYVLVYYKQTSTSTSKTYFRTKLYSVSYGLVMPNCLALVYKRSSSAQFARGIFFSKESNGDILCCLMSYDASYSSYWELYGCSLTTYGGSKIGYISNPDSTEPAINAPKAYYTVLAPFQFVGNPIKSENFFLVRAIQTYNPSQDDTTPAHQYSRYDLQLALGDNTYFCNGTLAIKDSE